MSFIPFTSFDHIWSVLRPKCKENKCSTETPSDPTPAIIHPIYYNNINKSLLFTPDLFINHLSPGTTYNAA